MKHVILSQAIFEGSPFARNTQRVLRQCTFRTFYCTDASTFRMGLWRTLRSAYREGMPIIILVAVVVSHAPSKSLKCRVALHPEDLRGYSLEKEKPRLHGHALQSRCRARNEDLEGKRQASRKLTCFQVGQTMTELKPKKRCSYTVVSRTWRI